MDIEAENNFETGQYAEEPEIFIHSITPYTFIQLISSERVPVNYSNIRVSCS